jgi:metal-responsive CopG/Arc/MetJ family transcriptional regulator
VAQSKKAKATYNLEPEVLEAFNKLAEEISLNRSKWIENKMRELLREHGKEVKEN